MANTTDIREALTTLEAHGVTTGEQYEALLALVPLAESCPYCVDARIQHPGLRGCLRHFPIGAAPDA